MSESGVRPPPGGHDLSTPGLLLLAAAAFLVELALFAGVGAVAHDAVGSGAVAWLAAVAATGATLLLWGLFMAPKGRWRLPPPARMLVALLLSVATAYGLLAAGRPVWGWFVGVAGLVLVAAQSVWMSPRVD